jgi:hypothetical protein
MYEVLCSTREHFDPHHVPRKPNLARWVSCGADAVLSVRTGRVETPETVRRTLSSTSAYPRRAKTAWRPRSSEEILGNWDL